MFFILKNNKAFYKHLGEKKNYAVTIGIYQDCLENQESTGHPIYVKISKQLDLFTRSKGTQSWVVKDLEC